MRAMQVITTSQCRGWQATKDWCVEAGGYQFMLIQKSDHVCVPLGVCVRVCAFLLE